MDSSGTEIFGLCAIEGDIGFGFDSDGLRKVLQQDGVRRLYKGLGKNVMRYVPGSAVLWATYASSQHQFWRLPRNENEVPSEWTIVGVQATSNVVAGVATTSFVSTPLSNTIQGAVRVMAKDLIRTRHQIEKFYKLKSQLQGVSLRIQTLKSTQAMGEAMKGVTKAMGQMNRQMNLPSLQKIMREFEMQNEKMELTSEVMGDAIDDALEGDEEEENEDLVSQVLDEIGIKLVNAPSGSVSTPTAMTKAPQAEATASEDGGIDDD